MFQKFKSGQAIACKIIDNTILKNHYAHAYLIETNGYDLGLDFAIAFAKAILCPNYNKGNPVCNNCSQCLAIDNGNFVELKIINPDGNWIKKEQLIDLQNEFNKKSLLGNKKVYIINKADKLNANSSNAILKFLEEPKEGIIAILVTDNSYQLLDTIVSRCQKISLNGQADFNKKDQTFEKIGQILTNNKDEFELFINDEKNKERLDYLIKFIKNYENNGKKVLLYMNEYWFSHFSTKEMIDNAILLLIYFYKDVLNFKISCEPEIYNDYIEFINLISKKNTVDNLLNKINILNENRKYIENNANLNLLMDRIIIQLESGVK